MPRRAKAQATPEEAPKPSVSGADTHKRTITASLDIPERYYATLADLTMFVNEAICRGFAMDEAVQFSTPSYGVVSRLSVTRIEQGEC